MCVAMHAEAGQTLQHQVAAELEDKIGEHHIFLQVDEAWSFCASDVHCKSVEWVSLPDYVPVPVERIFFQTTLYL